MTFASSKANPKHALNPILGYWCFFGESHILNRAPENVKIFLRSKIIREHAFPIHSKQ